MVVGVGMWAEVDGASGKTKVRKEGNYIYIMAHTKFHTKTLRVVSAR